MPDPTQTAEVALIFKDLVSESAKAATGAIAELRKAIAELKKQADATSVAVGATAKRVDPVAETLRDVALAASAAKSGPRVFSEFGAAARTNSGALQLFATGARAVAGAVGTVAGGVRTAIGALTSFKSLLLAGAGVFAARAVVNSLVETSEALDTLVATSSRTGIAIDQLSRLRVASKLANVDFGVLAQGLRGLNTAIAQFGQSKPIREAFDAVGISENDVRAARNAADLLPKIAAGFEQLTDAERTAVAGTLFGRTGFAIAPILESSERLQRSLKQVDELGLTLTRNEVERGARVANALSLVRFGWERVKIAILDAIGPATADLLERFTRLLTSIPQRIGNIAAAVRTLSQGAAEALPEDQAGPPAPAAAAAQALIQIKNQALDFALETFVAAGRILGLTFLDVVRAGAVALTPTIQRVFRDALGPVLSEIPGVSIKPTARGELESLKNQGSEFVRLLVQLGQVRQEIDRIRDQSLRDVTVGDRFKTELELAAQEGKRAVLEAEIEKLRPQFDALVSRQTELEKAIAEENTTQIKALADAITEVGQTAATEVEHARQKLGELGRSILDTADQMGVFRAEAQETGIEFPDIGKAIGDTISDVGGALARLATGGRRAFASLVQGALQFSAEMRSLQARSLGARGLTEDAQRAELAARQAQEIAEANRSGVAGQLLSTLLATQAAERQGLELRLQITKATKDVADAEKDYRESLQETEQLKQIGALTDEQARTRTEERRAQLEQLVTQSIAALARLGERNPDFARLTDDAIESLVRLQKEMQLTGAASRTLFDGVRAGLQDLANQVGTVFDFGRRAVVDIAQTMSQEFTGAIKSVLQGTESLGRAFLNFFANTAEHIADLIAQFLFLRLIMAATGFSPLGANSGGLISGRNRGGMIYRAGGGIVPGRDVNADTVMTGLTKGEFVHRRDAVDYYGVGVMNAINRMLVPRDVLAGFGAGDYRSHAPYFNAGGQVGAGPASAVPAFVVADSRTMENLLRGGEAAMLRFLSDHRGKY